MEFRVGDIVEHNGERGKVVSVCYSPNFPVLVQFDSSQRTYTAEGREFMGELVELKHVPNLSTVDDEMLGTLTRDMIDVLTLIASPKRPDGTYNRDRQACELLAKEVLRKHGFLR